MKKRAKRPLDRDAAKKADDDFYAAHPELVKKDGTRIPLKPGDPRCAEWMEHYEDNGGEVEGSGAAQKPDNPVTPCHARQIVLELVTDDGYPIPEAAFQLECKGGTVKTGVLDKSGRRTVSGLPENTPFAVYYPDESDVRAKAFAARLNDGLSQASAETVLGVLMQPAAELLAIAQMFERYFDGPMAERCRDAFAAHECLPIIENLLARAGLFSEAILIQYDEGR